MAEKKLKLSEQIRQAVETCGQTRYAIFKATGIDQATLSRFVNGERGLPMMLKSLKDAYEAAQNYAQRPRGWFVLTGDYSAGKTHLAAAIANHRAQLGDPPLFVMVPDLLDHLRATFSPNSQTTFDRRFDEIRTTPLLVLDDLGTQSMTPWVREKLYQLFNYRSNAELPTVITIAADALEELDARIRSRLLDARFCRIIGITAPAYRGKSVKKAKK